MNILFNICDELQKNYQIIWKILDNKKKRYIGSYNMQQKFNMQE